MTSGASSYSGMSLLPLALKESGRFEPPGPVASMRRFPFPYKCALAIVNDTRGTALSAFEDYHAVFAAEKIEVGDSFSLNPEDEISIGSERIRDLARAGLLDVVAGLPPDGVEEAVESLDRFDLFPSCYIGGPPIAEALQLTTRGVRFFSDDTWLCDNKFGDHHDYRMARQLERVLGGFSFEEFAKRNRGVASDSGYLLSTLKGDALRSLKIALFNRSTYPLTDEKKSWAFKRYRGGQDPSVTTLPIQLRTWFMDSLDANGGCLFIAQKMGEWCLIGRAKEDERRVRSARPVFDFHGLTCVDDIATRVRAGNLLVATPGRLLDWLHRREAVVFECQTQDDLWTIRILGIRSHSGAELRPLADADFNGLAFTVPSKAPKVVISAAGRKELLPVMRSADPDLKDYDAVYLPWEALEWPSPKLA